MQIRVPVRRIGTLVVLAGALGVVGIAWEATIRGTLTTPDQRVVTALYSRPTPWAGGRAQPIALGTLNGNPLESRIPVRLGDLPDHLVQAVLAVEDQRFYRHLGLDLRRIGGALVANIRARSITQGGSTLTQQLAKNLFLSSDRTLLRKAREAALALALEDRYDKDTILEAYLNEIYLGQDGARPIHGVGAAARFYFGKDVERISLAESALLAGMIQAPNRYAPTRHAQSARERRNLVLSLMIEQQRVNGPAARRATRANLPNREHSTFTVEGRWFRDHVASAIPGRLPARGVALHTSLDALLQRAAERAVRGELARIRRHAPRAEAAMVALDPRTGDILAMVGGGEYGRSQFNRATRARRQPGSAFKPIVALAALERGDQGEPAFTLASMVEDTPLRVRAGGKVWQPANYDGEFRGPVTVRQAMEQSLNVPFARIGMQVGPERVVRTARRLGISGPLSPVPSLALGSAEVTLLELARAYGVLAAQGELAAERTMLGSARQGERLESVAEPEVVRVADPAATWLVTSMLQGVVTRGTGRGLDVRGRLEGIAGKTGTSNDWRDAWFVAYGPAIVVAVWVGRDDGASLGLTGAGAAMPIAAGFLQEIVPRDGWDAPQAPDGVVMASVASGEEGWFWDCGTSEYFLEGTEPANQECSHYEMEIPERVREWGERWGGRRGERWGERLGEELERRVLRALEDLAAQAREPRRGGR